MKGLGKAAVIIAVVAMIACLANQTVNGFSVRDMILTGIFALYLLSVVIGKAVAKADSDKEK